MTYQSFFTALQLSRRSSVDVHVMLNCFTLPQYGISQELSALTFLLLSVTYSIFAIAVGKVTEKIVSL